MKTLVLDIGNTASKYGCFESGQLREQGVLAGPADLPALLRRWPVAHAILASVAADPGEWQARLTAQVPGQVLTFEPGTTPIPLGNEYVTPHTLGADRLAAAVGAAALWPGQTLLIVDAGTALKCDLVRAGAFAGGSIAPGLSLRLRALHAFTGRLPLLSLPPPDENVQLTGTSTASAMLSGVLNGALAEVRGFVAEYQGRYPDLGVVLTGGDAPYFSARLAGRIFVVPELVLLGLDRILAYHVEK